MSIFSKIRILHGISKNLHILALKVTSIREVTGSHIKTNFFTPAYLSSIVCMCQDNKSLFYKA